MSYKTAYHIRFSNSSYLRISQPVRLFQHSKPRFSPLPLNSNLQGRLEPRFKSAQVYSPSSAEPPDSEVEQALQELNEKYAHMQQNMADLQAQVAGLSAAIASRQATDNMRTQPHVQSVHASGGEADSRPPRPWLIESLIRLEQGDWSHPIDVVILLAILVLNFVGIGIAIYRFLS